MATTFRFRTPKMFEHEKDQRKQDIINTKQGLGFRRNRKYDSDLDRLGRMASSQRELSKSMGTFQEEMRKLSRELKDK